MGIKVCFMYCVKDLCGGRTPSFLGWGCTVSAKDWLPLSQNGHCYSSRCITNKMDGKSISSKQINMYSITPCPCFFVCCFFLFMFKKKENSYHAYLFSLFSLATLSLPSIERLK